MKYDKTRSNLCGFWGSQKSTLLVCSCRDEGFLQSSSSSKQSHPRVFFPSHHFKNCSAVSLRHQHIMITIQQPNLWDFCFRFHLASPSLAFLQYGVVSSRLQHFATTILAVDFNIYSQWSLQNHIAESLLSRSQLVFGDPDLATHSKATGYGNGGYLRSQNPQKGPRVGWFWCIMRLQDFAFEGWWHWSW